MEVEIYESNYAVPRYTDAIGLPHQGKATLTLEDVEDIFRKANLERNIPLLRKGKGRRTVELDVFLTEFLMESFGFNEVGAMLGTIAFRSEKKVTEQTATGPGRGATR
jgi:hypothetical protein